MTGGSPVRILWLTPDKPASISVGRQRIAAHLKAAGHRIVLRGTTFRTVYRSLRERGQYDVVLGTTRAGAFAGGLVAQLHGIPFVVDHIDPISQFGKTANWPLPMIVGWLENRAFWLADHVLYVYEEEQARVTNHAAAATSTDLGVDYDRFADPDPAAIERVNSAFAWPGDRVAIYVGGLEPLYNIRPMLAAMDQLEDWTLLVLGTGSLEDAVEAAAASRANVCYPGTVPHTDVPGYLAVADVGISLVDDPHTLKILEYLAAGLPVVQQSGRAEGRFGKLLTYADPTPSSIAEAVRAAKGGGSADDRREFARAFDWAAIADDYESVLTAVQA